MSQSLIYCIWHYRSKIFYSFLKIYCINCSTLVITNKILVLYSDTTVTKVKTSRNRFSTLQPKYLGRITGKENPKLKPSSDNELLCIIKWYKI